MSEIISLSLVLLVVLGVSILMRLFKQPLIIGYILSGILVGPLVLNILPKGEMLTVFSEFGIAFLLFLVGLHLSPKVIREVGKISLITGLGQVIFTSTIGYLICLKIGFSVIASIYISVALTFSSTIIIMKLLSDKDALEKLYGRISIGFLLVQDLVAVIILIFVSSMSISANFSSIIFLIFGKGFLVFILLFFIGIYILPKFESFFARSQEFLFLFAIVFGLGIASLFSFIGLGLEVGALVAGIVLSMSSFSTDVGSKLRPLRDFFIISFFITLGSGMLFSEVSGMMGWVIIFSLFILIGNPLIVIILMGLFGYSKKTGFMAGLTVAQISEFSLILIGMGVKVGHLVPEQIGSSIVHIPSLVTLVGLITIAGSTYMIMYSDFLYKFLSKPLSIFERKKLKEKEEIYNIPEYVLIGENRVGFSIMEYFQKSKKNYLIVDFNPKRVKRLRTKGANCIYGDVSNSGFLEELDLEKAKMVVSTVPEVDVNLMLIKKIREINKDSIILVSCNRISEVGSLYRAGANYVLVPNVVAGESLANLIERINLDKKKYFTEVKKQIKDFDKRLKF
jgi:Kef-type K+ transport system membrane component KefB/voltage-gated potassium channel Kch